MNDARQVTSNGGTLNVLQGSSTTESVTFSNAVTLQRYDGSAAAGTATITGLQSFSATSTVTGLTLVGAVSTSADLTLSNNTISNSGGTAVNVTGGTTTLTGNTIQSGGTAVNVSGGTTTLTGNTIQSATTGIAATGSSTVILSSGTITSGVTTGVTRSGSGTTTISGGTISAATTGVSNTAGTTDINGGTISGSTTGVSVTGGTTSFSGGTISGTGPGAGISVNGGTATISGGSIKGNSTGVVFSSGTASVGGVSFARGGGSANVTDIYLDKSTGFTFNSGVTFDASDVYIYNNTATPYDLTAVSPTFKNGTTTYDYNNAANTDNFRIEDRIYHANDDSSLGKITWVANNTYITAPGTGTTSTDSSIQNGIDISVGGDTVRVEAGTYAEDVTVATAGLNILGAQAGNAGTSAPRATESTVNGTGTAFTLAANDVVVDGFTLQGTTGVTYSGSPTGTSVRNNRITSSGVGLNLTTASVPTLTANYFLGNTTGIAAAGSGSLTFGTGNTIDGAVTGISQSGSTGSTTVSGGTITNSTTGLAVSDGTATVIGGTFSGNTTGISQSGGTLDVSTTTATITGGTTGLEISDSGSILTGDTLGSLSFSGQSGKYITLSSGALNGAANSSTAINAGAVSFDGTIISGISPLDLTLAVNRNLAYSIEDKITDQLDDSTLGHIQLRGNAAFATVASATGVIQRAIDAEGVTTNGMVYVQAGVYNSTNVTVGVTGLTLQGEGRSSGTNLLPTTGTGVTVTADNVTIKDLQVQGPIGTTTGVSLATGVDDVKLTNLTLSLNQSGVLIENSTTTLTNLTLNNVLASGNGNGFEITASGKVNGLTVTNSNFDNNLYGFSTTADTSRPSTDQAGEVTNVTFTNTTYSNNTRKGIYVEKIDNVQFGTAGAGNGVILANNAASTTNLMFQSGVGFDINLKYGNYSNITILGTLTSNGVNNGSNGYGLAVKARNDNAGPTGAKYNSFPATLTNLYLGSGSDGLSITTPTLSGGSVGSVSALAIGNNVTLGTVAASNLSLNGSGGGGLVLFGQSTGTLILSNTTTFNSNLNNYIANTSANNVIVDAVSATFGVVPAGSGLTQAQGYAIANKVLDYVDSAHIGKVVLRAGHAYVTPDSYLNAFLTTTPDIQRAIDSLGASGGTVNIQAGTYTGNVSTAAGAFTLAPGTDGPASVTITGNLTLDSNDTLSVDLNGTTAGTDYDQLVVTGNATLGNATVSATLGYAPTLADQFTLVSATGTLSGTFSNTIPFTVGTTKLYPTYYANSAKLTATPVDLPLTVYVDDSYTGSEQTGEVVAFPQSGSASAPYVFGYNTQNTIAAAQALLGTGTTTVNVADGTYTEAVTIAANQTLTVNNGNVTAKSLAGGAASTLNLNGNDFTYGDGTDVTFNGVFVGTGTSSVIKQGAGKSTLTGNSNGYTGNFDINDGRVNLSTSTTKLGGAVNVGTSGTLTGIGRVGGLLTNNGTVSPGNAGAGTLTAAGGYTQTGTGTLVVEYTGAAGAGAPVAGTDYDQLAVTGLVTLDGNLSFNGTGNAPANFKGLTFIANDSTDAITGTFSGKTGGTVYDFGGGNLYLVTYAGDSGNDFLLLKVNTAANLTPVYVDDSWASLPGGSAVTTPDGTAYVSFNAFGTLAGGLGKQSTGGLIDVSSGTYAGGVSHTTGTIRLRNNPGDLSPNGVVISGTLDTNSGTTLNLNRVPLTVNGGTITGVIIGVGSTSSLTNAGGTLTLNNTANSYKGSTTVTGGTLALGTDEVIPDGSPVVVNGGTLNLAGFVETIGSLEGTGGSVNLGSGGELATGGNGRSGNYAGVISGSGTLIKDGAGILTLSGTNTYTGTTTINAGTLQLGNNGTTGVINTPVAVGAGATLAFNRSDIVTQDTFLGTGNGISGDGYVSQNGSGGSQLTTGVNSYKGGTVINKGTLTVLADANLGDVGTNAGVFINNAGRMVIANDLTTSRPVTMSTLSGSISVNVGKTLTLNNNTVTGGMLRGDGTIVLQGGATVDSTTILNGTTVKTTGTASVLNNINNFGTVNVQGATTATLNNFNNSTTGKFLVVGTANVNGFSTTGYTQVSETGTKGSLVNIGSTELQFGAGSVTGISVGSDGFGAFIALNGSGGDDATRVARGTISIGVGMNMTAGAVVRNNGSIVTSELFALLINSVNSVYYYGVEGPNGENGIGGIGGAVFQVGDGLITIGGF